MAHEGKVLISFPEPFSWVSFSPKEARDMAQRLIEMAEVIEKMT